MPHHDLDLLIELQQIPGPSGDEGRIADFVERHCRRVPGATVRRVSDLVLATRGTPRVAIFAHIDTIGFTQGYDRRLVPIGGPHAEGGEQLREVDGPGTARLQVRRKGA
ncbi:MAG TPA: hypothetical protein VK689_05575, partial [Armatimonadota bacterium]|nr:hypothetical protein [Armatimonadota bacterium]